MYRKRQPTAQTLLRHELYNHNTSECVVNLRKSGSSSKRSLTERAACRPALMLNLPVSHGHRPGCSLLLRRRTHRGPHRTLLHHPDCSNISESEQKNKTKVRRQTRSVTRQAKTAMADIVHGRKARTNAKHQAGRQARRQADT